MKIRELFEKHREYYLKHFQNALNDSKDGVAELLIELNNKDKEPEELFRLYRVDYCRNQKGETKVIEFNQDGYLNHEPIEYEVNDIKIIVHPFVWNGCEIQIDSKMSSMTDLTTWIKKWLDIEGKNIEDNNGLTGVIHSVTSPETKDNETAFSIDLGTAPIDSLMELLEIFLNDGATKTIVIASPIFIN